MDKDKDKKMSERMRVVARCRWGLRPETATIRVRKTTAERLKVVARYRRIGAIEYASDVLDEELSAFDGIEKEEV